MRETGNTPCTRASVSFRRAPTLDLGEDLWLDHGKNNTQEVGAGAEGGEVFMPA